MTVTFSISSNGSTLLNTTLYSGSGPEISAGTGAAPNSGTTNVNTSQTYTVGTSDGASVTCTFTVTVSNANGGNYTVSLGSGEFKTDADVALAGGKAFFLATNSNDSTYEIADSLD